MNKKIVSMAMVALLSSSVYAQNSPKLLKAYGDSQTFKFEYNSKGQIVKDVYSYVDEDGETETRTNTYTYASDKIVQRYAEGNLRDTDTRTGIIENGKLKSETIILNAESPKQPQYNQTYNFTYNAANQLVKIESTSGSAFNDEIHEVTWTDGCPSNIKTYRAGKLTGEMNITYDTSVTNPYIIMLANPFQHFLAYEAIQPHAQLLGGYYGTPVKYALSSVKYVEYVENAYNWSAEDNFDISYTTNAKGEIVGAVQTGSEPQTMNFEWENTVTGITNHICNNTSATAYYNMEGVRQAGMCKGLNIIRSADGTVRKVLK